MLFNRLTELKHLYVYIRCGCGLAKHRCTVPEVPAAKISRASYPSGTLPGLEPLLSSWSGLGFWLALWEMESFSAVVADFPMRVEEALTVQDYTTLCLPPHCEILSIITLRCPETFLVRNRQIAASNYLLLQKVTLLHPARVVLFSSFQLLWRTG